MSRTRLTLLLLAGLLLGGCAEAERDTFAVEITSTHQFQPSSIRVPVGTTVVWENRSTRPHAVAYAPARAAELLRAVAPGTLAEGVVPWDSGVLYPGEWWGYTFEQPGLYLYTSRFHPLQGLAREPSVPRERLPGEQPRPAIGLIWVTARPDP